MLTPTGWKCRQAHSRRYSSALMPTLTTLQHGVLVGATPESAAG
jgi:hypothetical protein